MIINEIMTVKPIIVGLDDRLGTVKRIFDEHRFHHVLVVDDGELVGVVSDRDLLKAISPNIDTSRFTEKDFITLGKPVHQIVSRKPITLMAGSLVAEAMAIFNTHRVSCIPIIDADRAPVGIVTWRDLMTHFQAMVDEQVKWRVDAAAAAAASAASAAAETTAPKPKT